MPDEIYSNSIEAAERQSASGAAQLEQKPVQDEGVASQSTADSWNEIFNKQTQEPALPDELPNLEVVSPAQDSTSLTPQTDVPASPLAAASETGLNSEDTSATQADTPSVGLPAEKQMTASALVSVETETNESPLTAAGDSKASAEAADVSQINPSSSYLTDAATESPAAEIDRAKTESLLLRTSAENKVSGKPAADEARWKAEISSVSSKVETLADKDEPEKKRARMLMQKLAEAIRELHAQNHDLESHLSSEELYAATYRENPSEKKAWSENSKLQSFLPATAQRFKEVDMVPFAAPTANAGPQAPDIVLSVRDLVVAEKDGRILLHTQDGLPLTKADGKPLSASELGTALSHDGSLRVSASGRIVPPLNAEHLDASSNQARLDGGRSSPQPESSTRQFTLSEAEQLTNNRSLVQTTTEKRAESMTTSGADSKKVTSTNKSGNISGDRNADTATHTNSGLMQIRQPQHTAPAHDTDSRATAQNGGEPLVRSIYNSHLQEEGTQKAAGGNGLIEGRQNSKNVTQSSLLSFDPVTAQKTGAQNQSSTASREFVDHRAHSARGGTSDSAEAVNKSRRTMPESLSFQQDFTAVSKEKAKAASIMSSQPQLRGSQLAKSEQDAELLEEETQDFEQREVLNHNQTSAALNNTQMSQTSAQTNPSNNTSTSPITTNEKRDDATNTALNCMHASIDLACSKPAQQTNRQHERSEAQPQCTKLHADAFVISKEQMLMERLAEQTDLCPEFTPRDSAVPLIMSVLAVRKTMLKVLETDDACAVIARLSNLSTERENSEQDTGRLHKGMRLISSSNSEAKDSIRKPYGTAWSVNELRGR